MNDLENKLVKSFGLLSAPTPNEVGTFTQKVLTLNHPSSDEIEKIASQIFSTYGKGIRSLNESQADTLYDLILLIKAKGGKTI